MIAAKLHLHPKKMRMEKSSKRRRMMISASKLKKQLPLLI
jgi:hypothetical protein